MAGATTLPDAERSWRANQVDFASKSGSRSAAGTSTIAEKDRPLIWAHYASKPTWPATTPCRRPRRFMSAFVERGRWQGVQPRRTRRVAIVILAAIGCRSHFNSRPRLEAGRHQLLGSR